MLEDELRERARERGILLMTHIVLGYPSMAESLQVVESMVEAGADLVELQIPFSEPIADGPVILRANQAALQAGCTVDACFEAAQELVQRFDVPFGFPGTVYRTLSTYSLPAERVNSQIEDTSTFDSVSSCIQYTVPGTSRNYAVPGTTRVPFSCFSCRSHPIGAACSLARTERSV